MTSRSTVFLRIALVAAVSLSTAALGQPVLAMDSAGSEVDRARRALASAKQGGEKALRVTERAEKTAREAAAVAARIQETEAGIAEQQAQLVLLGGQLDQLRMTLAQRQKPVVRLTAALQRLSRRPPAFALFRPGSVRDTVYLRAMFDTILPQIKDQTAALRAEIDKAQKLEAQQAKTAQNLLKSEANLRKRQTKLASIESRQRLASRKASGIASREADRALALAEKAKDLGVLVKAVGKQGQLREELALLPGPIMRPPRPEESRVLKVGNFEAVPQALSTYLLPASGRLVSGFGEEVDGGLPSRGIALAVRGGAQAVAPAPGRVAYAALYRGYGQIVIIEHNGGWTSLVTGLAKLNVDVGTGWSRVPRWALLRQLIR